MTQQHFQENNSAFVKDFIDLCGRNKIFYIFIIYLIFNSDINLKKFFLTICPFKVKDLFQQNTTLDFA